MSSGVGLGVDKAGLLIPVEISVCEDRSYTFIFKTPPAKLDCTISVHQEVEMY